MKRIPFTATSLAAGLLTAALVLPTAAMAQKKQHVKEPVKQNKADACVILFEFARRIMHRSTEFAIRNRKKICRPLITAR